MQYVYRERKSHHFRPLVKIRRENSNGDDKNIMNGEAEGNLEKAEKERGLQISPRLKWRETLLADTHTKGGILLQMCHVNFIDSIIRINDDR